MSPIAEREEDLASIVRAMHTVAVVGIKDGIEDPDAPGFTIPTMLARNGYNVIGVNPMLEEALGEKALASVAELPEWVDVVNVFRRSDALPELAAQLLALPEERRPAVVWFQSGIRHDEVAQRLSEAGFTVVQDRCLGVYANRYR